MITLEPVWCATLIVSLIGNTASEVPTAEEIALHCSTFGPLKILGNQALTEADRGGWNPPQFGQGGSASPADPVEHGLHVVAIVTFETGDLAGGAMDLDDPIGERNPPAGAVRRHFG